MTPSLRRLLGLLMVMMTLLCCAEAGAESIHNDRPDFTLVVPDGYQQMLAAGQTLYTFVSDGSNGTIRGAAITITRLGGTIGQEHLQLPANSPIAGASVVQRKWHEYDVDVLVVPQTTAAGKSMTVMGAQIPLRGEAIQVNVAVPGANVAAAEAILAKCLDGLTGPSNWPPPGATHEAVKQEIHLLGLIVGSVLLSVALVLLTRHLMAARRAADPNPPPIDSKPARHKLAMKIAAPVTVLSALFIVIGTIALIHSEITGLNPEDSVRRDQLIIEGVVKLEVFICLITYVLTRGVIRLRRGKVQPPPTMPG